MSINTSERQFEADIETAFISNGYRQISPSLYNAETGVFADILTEFISTSQPKEWARYVKFYGERATEKLVRRFNDSVEARGVLDVMKNGFDDMGIKLKMCFFRPESTLNQELVNLYHKNIIGITRQFKYSTQNNNSIDMVISINGVPLFAFELKDQLKGQDYMNAIKQWREDRDPREMCFKFNKRFLAYFAVDLYEVWMTTELKGEGTYFLPFNQGSEGAGKAGGAGNPVKDGYITSYLWDTVFSVDSTFDLLNKFITLDVTKEEYFVNGVKKTEIKQKLIFPRYHQYDVVNKIVESIKTNGAGKNYLIEHSAGSGKSNSIAWIAYRCASAFDKDDNPIFDSVIVVTNRIVLDSQLQDTINSFEHKAGLVECITQQKGSRGLVDAINDKRKIIICTIQKFLYAYSDFDKLTDRKFAIIIDEAHQGQSGESARTLRKSLIDVDKELIKYADENYIDVADLDDQDGLINEILAMGHHENQSFFAFTATPIGKTVELFGTQTDASGKKRPFHTYSMRQAIEEGFILNVLKDYLTVQEAFKLVKDSEDNPELIEEKAKRALFRYYKSHDFTIREKVEMIMDNFLHNGRHKINGHGKAMVVADSRHNAVRYFFEIKDYIKRNKDQCAGCDVLVAFSGEVRFDGMTSDEPSLTEANLNKDHQGRFIVGDKKFRQAFRSDEFNILVVANKYQTGYDEPYLHSMYVDKKLRSVNAVQTLSRLNRTCAGKKDTFVLDFCNKAEEIKNAFQPFYEETTLEGETNINRVYDLRSQVETYALFTSAEVDLFTKIMTENGGNTRKQDSLTLGKLTAIIKPVVDRYKDIEDISRRFEARDAIMKFIRTYAFVTQLVRLNDFDLYKDYVFCSYLLHMLPKNTVEVIDISDKIKLEYAQLKETFRGEIELEKTKGVFKPAEPVKAKFKPKKVDTLERIIDKLNEQYEGEFEAGDKVAVDSVFKMLMDDDVVKSRLREYAKTNDANMFINSIFPSEFQRVLVECFMQNNNAYEKLLGNPLFQKAVMDIMAKELYKTLKSNEE